MGDKDKGDKMCSVGFAPECGWEIQNMILGQIFTCQQFSGDYKQKHEIWGKSVLVYVRDDHIQWIIKDVIWEERSSPN